jgi:DNA polymerase (family 10)
MMTTTAKEKTTVKLEEAQTIADRVKEILTPYCDRIEIAGSIRRRKPLVHDIDIVLIEKADTALMLSSLLFTLGVVRINGTDIKRLLLTDQNISVDIYLATPATWATLLLIRTGSKENNIRLATTAKTRGWHLKANGDGLFDDENNRVAGDTEQSIYEALGIPYQEPENRDGPYAQVRN